MQWSAQKTLESVRVTVDLYELITRQTRPRMSHNDQQQLQLTCQNRAIFGSIWAVGLPVCPPVRLPMLACIRAPHKPRPAAAARAVYFGPQPSHARGHTSWQSYISREIIICCWTTCSVSRICPLAMADTCVEFDSAALLLLPLSLHFLPWKCTT